MRYKAIQVVALLGLLAACASVAPWDNPYTLDLPNSDLRNADPKKDLPLSACDTQTLPSGVKQYPCVVHMMSDYLAMLNKVSQLEEDLNAAQQALTQCQASHD